MTSEWEAARRAAWEAGRRTIRGAETRPLEAAAGRTLAAALVAPVDVPGCDTSAMDGWAVAGAPPWRVGDAIPVGSAPDPRPLVSGTARPIATGAPVPPGAGILRREHGEERDGRLTPRTGTAAPAAGKDVRPAGSDVAAGEVVLPAGSRLTPPALALAAICGMDELEVRVPPRVLLLVVGEEIEVSGVPSPGRVRDAYGPQLPGVLAALGAGEVDVRHLGGDADQLLAELGVSDADLVVTTGGTSQGPTDHVRAAAASRGWSAVVDGVAMRPGHPVLLAIGPSGRPLLALPGNPFAAMVALLSLGVPLLDGMLGRRTPSPVPAPAAVELENPGRGVRVLACRRSADGVVPLPQQGPATLRGLAEADVLALVPIGGTRAGAPVPVLSLPW
ncbi:molybdopterin molybdotransferase MoeA [Naasia aerilata]|uniref:Molybdopterin molybdenumtransferase n=1 Tax=Naasia aerilata TaxID=1162966 RepID=A0ABM8GFX3_9MICO|nr:molybdopterin molybdotransferase MoeA [Naasia aerilata]BDZ47250.1 molybdopterin molybdenumtransferase MoeA [Naasia aerilata]